ncbi:response regulator transcription factor [Vallitalea okinawensis]|uniref:response regulator transcription factor n=1 Tax=Vallitalea okinawensis TaxID=2078660 RepID=UPI000CFDD73E|nr:response regulator [Vallitalea okinawensis]
MYNILIVDDEGIERRGIRSLINKYNLELNVTEAQNGEEALEYIKKQTVDILFTDIKMPFMDGIELTDEALKINSNIKVIFYSAYNEFEYAMKAIDLKVKKYILKPIDIDQFLNVMNDVVSLCKQERKEDEVKEKLIECYNKSVQYEKEKILLDIIRGLKCDEHLKKRIQNLNMNINNDGLRMILLDFEDKFFDIENLKFEDGLKEELLIPYDYLNLNEYQSVLFFTENENTLTKEYTISICEGLQDWISNFYDKTSSCMVISRPITNLDDIHFEFNQMDKRLEDKFFTNEALILFTEDYSFKISNFPEFMDKSLKDINIYLRRKDYFSVKRKLDVFFDRLQECKNTISSMYLKYICMEIVKKIYEGCSGRIREDFQESLESIFNAQSLTKLKKILIEMIEHEEAKQLHPIDKSQKNVIEKVIKIIRRDYMKDISLQMIAEKVYLSPSYLSHLFKKEIGESLVQFITSYRLEMAKELLEETNLKVIDISKQVGYSNLSYFGTVFKNHYGMTPAKYRERNSQP